MARRQSKQRTDTRTFRPQPGPQEQFLACDADIAFYGGAAGGGKTYGILLDALRHAKDDPRFGATIFRRQGVDLMQEGGVWDESEGIFPWFGATGSRHSRLWRFPSGARIKMAHLEHDKTRFRYQGAQIRYIAFEELTQFTEKQFWYMVSRNRAPRGGRCYIRATMNPDPDSFVRRMIDWWIGKDGYAIAARSGVVRWFIRYRDKLEWDDTPQELRRRFGRNVRPRSFTFISANVFDNPILLANNPDYLAALESMSLVEREQLLKGNWDIRASAGTMFRREWFGAPLDVAPAGAEVVRAIRYWDRAASQAKKNSTASWTAGVKVLQVRGRVGSTFIVADVRRFQGRPAAVERSIVTTATQDGQQVEVGIEQDPGQAGVAEASYYTRALAGWPVRAITVGANKERRAVPASAQAEAHNIGYVRGAWNDEFFLELENFPDGLNNDQVDGLSGAIGQMLEGSRFAVQGVDRDQATGDAQTDAPEQQTTGRKVFFSRGKVVV
jgi:predicted phage terminase large subunit-like protein